jgi:hypothetical protein
MGSEAGDAAQVDAQAPAIDRNKPSPSPPPPPSRDAADADAEADAAPTPVAAATAPAPATTTTLSKKAQKRMARAARVAEFRAARKEQRRDEKRKAREATQRAKRQRWAEEDAAAANKEGQGDGDGDGASNPNKQQRSEAARQAHERRLEQARARAARRAAATAPGAQRIAVDLRWSDARMTHPERRSLAQQLSFAYSAALGGGGGSAGAVAADEGAVAAEAVALPPPLHLHLLGAGGLLRAQMEAQLVGLGRWAATVVHDDALLIVETPPAGGEGEGVGQGAGGEGAAATAEAPTPAPAPKPFDDDGGDAGAVPIAEFFARRGVAARDLVYLSADSPHELEGDDDDEEEEDKGAGEKANDANASPSSKRLRRGLDPSKVYVVGGIVDRNRHKGACLRRAEAAGMSHARLPIERHLMAAAAAAAAGSAAEGGGGGGKRLAGSRVLTVNQVVELLARRAAGDTWARALAVVIPSRKTEEVPAVVAKAGAVAAGDDGKDAAEKKDAHDAATTNRE